MDKRLKALLEQFHDFGQDGSLGKEVKNLTKEYGSINSNIEICKKYLRGFYSDSGDEVHASLDAFIKMLIIVYRDAKRKDENIAYNFINSFIIDIPDMKGSSLLIKWITLSESCLGFRNLISMNNRSILWQQSSKIIMVMNEFLDGLIGHLIIAWRCALGKTFKYNVLNNNYGSKLNELEALTGGENGPFYLIFRLAKPSLRNAIAHGNAWLDSEYNMIRFIDGQRLKKDNSISLIEFLGLVKMGCDIGRSYIAFLATIILLENDEFDTVRKINNNIVQVWNSNTSLDTVMK